MNPARSGQPECLLADAWERLRLLASYNQVSGVPQNAHPHNCMLAVAQPKWPVLLAPVVRGTALLMCKRRCLRLTRMRPSFNCLLQEPAYDFGAVLERAAELGAKRLIICDPGESPFKSACLQGLARADELYRPSVYIQSTSACVASRQDTGAWGGLPTSLPVA